MRDAALAIFDVLYADSADFLKDDVRHVCLDHDRETFARQRRIEISRRRALAASFADGHLHSRETILALAVIVIVEFVARAGGSFETNGSW